MRIWIVNHYAKPPAASGGTRHYALAKELRRRGHRATVVVASFDHGTRKQAFVVPGKNWRSGTVDAEKRLWRFYPRMPSDTIARGAGTEIPSAANHLAVAAKRGDAECTSALLSCT